MTYRYLINKEADNSSFDAAVEKIKHYFPSLQQKEPIIDVDGSVDIIFENDEIEIRASNDYYSDMVYVDSNIRLEQLGYPYSREIG